MILKEFRVYSNEKILKNYIFNQNGLNIILGDKRNPNEDSNGSGKTTLIESIRFILGGNIDKYYSENSTLLEKNISIALVVNSDKEYLFMRKFSNPNKGYICEGNQYNKDICVEKEFDDYKEFINNLVLEEKDNTRPSLQSINQYIIRDEQNGFLKDRLGVADRPEKNASKVFSYLANLPYNAESEINDYTRKITELNQLKKAHKLIKQKSISELKSMKKKLQKEISKIEDQLQKINVVKQYQVDASDYRKVKIELNQYQKELFKKEHIINQYQKNINNLKKKNEEIKKLEELENFYTELIDLFPEKVKHNQISIEHFHNFMLENRGSYYENKIITIKNEIDKLTKIIEKLQTKVSFVTENLRETTIISDINSILKNKDHLTIQLGITESEIESYDRIKELQGNIIDAESDKLKLIKEKMDEFNAAEDSKSNTEKNFNKLVSVTYPDAESNLTIEINTDAKGGQRATTGRVIYNCSLSYSRSQGISHMKINLFDLSLFLTNLEYSNKPIGYLFHDGSYSKNDEDAKERIFDHIDKKLKKIGYGQYFITINKTELSSKAFKKYTENNIITVKLDRNKDENRLFSFKFDKAIQK